MTLNLATIQADITAGENTVNTLLGIFDPAAEAPAEVVEAGVAAATSIISKLYAGISTLRGQSTQTWAQLSAQVVSDFNAFEAMLAAANAAAAGGSQLGSAAT